MSEHDGRPSRNSPAEVTAPDRMPRDAESPRRRYRTYSDWVRMFDTIGDAERALIRRRLRELKRQPLISVIVPVYNPELEQFAAAIASVRAQIYSNWELCLADDASTDPAVAAALREQAANDSRIKLVIRDSNGHIAACSNSAIAVATGEWIALLDQDDLLPEHALALVAAAINQAPEAEMIYSDEDKVDEDGRRCDPFFKSDWNPELLLGYNYINHLAVYRASLVRKAGGFREGFRGSQDYDLALRCSEQLRPDQIVHIPRVLYHWRKSASSVAAAPEAKPYAVEAARAAIREHLQRREIAGEVLPCAEHGEWHRVRYDVAREPLVSIIIPTRDRPALLRQCIESIRRNTAYPQFEIVIVDNESGDEETKTFLREFEKTPDARVVHVQGKFNFSRLINAGARAAAGEILCLLNNDTEATEAGWLGEMVSHAVRPEIGAVGARLWFPNGTLQHAGVVLGLDGVAGHAFYNHPPRPIAEMNRTFALAQNFCAVTAACLLVRKAVLEEAGGFDENLPTNFNDVDFCLRLHARGLLNVWTPYANLLHHESASRGREATREIWRRLFEDARYLEDRWGELIASDPFYNPNLPIRSTTSKLAVPPRWQGVAAMTQLENFAEQEFSTAGEFADLAE